jgi:CrcB protein
MGTSAVRYVWVGLAGAAGAVTRYAIGRAAGPTRWPWVTLAINVSGSFLLAVLLTVAMYRRVSADVAAAAGAGFLGAYTTFSTFEWETFLLGREGRTAAAVAYVTVSVAGGLAAALLGYAVGRAVR